MADYVPLWCKSNYSFLEGASHPDELVEQSQQLGLDALALTDRDGVYGIVRAHVRAQQLGVKLLLGAEVSVGPAVEDARPIVLLATDRLGYGNLCRLLTVGRRRCVKGSSVVHEGELLEHADGLLALWNGVLFGDDAGATGRLRDAFGDRLYAMIGRHREAAEVAPERQLRATAGRLGIPTVAAVEVLYHSRARRPLQDVLSCIRHGVNVHSAGTRTRPNAEHALLQPAAMARLFEDDPRSLARTVEVAARCTFSLAELRYRYPTERLPDGRTSMQWLRELTTDGAMRRYGGAISERVQRQLDRELDLIEELEYPGYFLTMREIVRYCEEHGILCQGRGSAANSAVCYCLGITAVDPVAMNLLFERFLSRERAEPPDIDLDIAHERREEVIQHVYDKYGRSHAAMVANVIRYRSKSAIRDVGKALDLPATSLDRLAKLASRWGHGVDFDWSGTLRQAGLDPDAPVHLHLVQLVADIQDFPRHLSIHPGGFLLGHEPVDSIVPIENGSMADRTVIQWDKDDIEILGLFKVDCLGLGALSLVDRAFQLLQEHRGLVLDLASVPEEDPATYAMICRGDTVGVFQIESRAQMAMLPRLRPRTFYDLVIEVSIVRPGPISGDMVHPYLRRRHGKEPVTYPHASLEPVLERTLGVPLFQEQVMKLAMVAADYTPGEADQLRRDMAAWRSSGRIDRHRERLVSRMGQKGIAAEFAERVFEQIRGFGEYGFPESHAASFALIAYVTSWLKCHHPDVFACALLNAQPMGFYSPATIVDDAKRHGVLVRPVDVQHSDIDCSLEISGEAALALRMGLRYVSGLSADGMARLVEARRERSFTGLPDFRQRARLNQKELAALAEIGAFESLAKASGGAGDRRDALWQVWKPAAEAGELALRDGGEQPEFAPLNVLEAVTWDYRAGHHSARGHPLEHLRPQLQRQRLVEALEIGRLRDGANVSTAGLVICRQRPGTAKGVVFMTLEDETGFVNLVVWHDVFEKFAALIKTATFLAVAGKLQHQDGVQHVIARRFWVPRVDLHPESGGSRDFH